MSIGIYIDSSDHEPCCLLIRGDRLASHFILKEKKGSSSLIAEIKNFLESNDLSLSALDYLCIGTGPGSFIGTRVAVIIGKTIAYALKKPLLHICSLRAFKPEQAGLFAIVADAKSKGFYLLNGSLEKGEIIYSETPKLFTDKEIKKNYNNHALIAADSSSLVKESLIKDDLTKGEKDFDCLAKDVFELYQKFINNPSSLTAPEIFYLRSS